MIDNKLQKNKRKNSGYTLLFAVLVSALVLAIGISILTIAKKEFLLATSARDSSSAFYAADSGIECAAYGELVKDAFKLDDDRRNLLGCNFTPPVIIPAPEVITNAYGSGKRFKFDINVISTQTSGGPCASITVEKTEDPTTGIVTTKIESRGYNTGWSGSSCTTQSAKRVERAIHLKY